MHPMKRLELRRAGVSFKGGSKGELISGLIRDSSFIYARSASDEATSDMIMRLLRFARNDNTNY